MIARYLILPTKECVFNINENNEKRFHFPLEAKKESFTTN